jgi:hypothetical protein
MMKARVQCERPRRDSGRWTAAVRSQAREITKASLRTHSDRAQHGRGKRKAQTFQSSMRRVLDLSTISQGGMFSVPSAQRRAPSPPSSSRSQSRYCFRRQDCPVRCSHTARPKSHGRSEVGTWRALECVSSTLCTNTSQQTWPRITSCGGWIELCSQSG